MSDFYGNFEILRKAIDIFPRAIKKTLTVLYNFRGLGGGGYRPQSEIFNYKAIVPMPHGLGWLRVVSTEFWVYYQSKPHLPLFSNAYVGLS